MDEDAEFLREQAAKCRRLAEGITGRDEATLLRMARDYDVRAVNAARDVRQGGAAG